MDKVKLLIAGAVGIIIPLAAFFAGDAVRKACDSVPAIEVEAPAE